MNQQLAYSDALKELEDIVKSIQENQLEIDQLKSAVARAGELIKICKAMLNETDLEIQSILANIE
ncbi:MAG: exodeoxyribonuclease VII small subunit [Bacteroidales bacterium]